MSRLRKVGDHGYARALGEPRRVAELHRVPGSGSGGAPFGRDSRWRERTCAATRCLRRRRPDARRVELRRAESRRARRDAVRHAMGRAGRAELPSALSGRARQLARAAAVETVRSTSAASTPSRLVPDISADVELGCALSAWSRSLEQREFAVLQQIESRQQAGRRCAGTQVARSPAAAVPAGNVMVSGLRFWS